MVSSFRVSPCSLVTRDALRLYIVTDAEVLSSVTLPVSKVSILIVQMNKKLHIIVCSWQAGPLKRKIVFFSCISPMPNTCPTAWLVIFKVGGSQCIQLGEENISMVTDLKTFLPWHETMLLFLYSFNIHCLGMTMAFSPPKNMPYMYDWIFRKYKL